MKTTKKRQEEKQQERKETTALNEAALTHFDIAGFASRVSHHPRVHEAGYPDPVGQSLLMIVSKVPSEAYKAGGRDGVSLQSFSTKVWILCPASYRSILGRQLVSKDEPDLEVKRQE